MSAAASHSESLIKLLGSKILSIHHTNGKRVAELYGSYCFQLLFSNYPGQHEPFSPEKQGPIIALNFFDNLGQYIGYNTVQRLANDQNVRGCYVNFLDSSPVRLHLQSRSMFPCGWL